MIASGVFWKLVGWPEDESAPGEVGAPSSGEAPT